MPTYSLNHEPDPRTKTNLLGLDRRAMQDFFAGISEKPFRGTQVFQWIHQHGVDDFDAMTNLSNKLRARLKDIATVSAPPVKESQIAADGTRKWLVQVDPVNAVEMVFIPEPDRATLCVSSQVGCPLNCSFCATGRQGFNRNLDATEIISQLWLANRLLGHECGKHRVITNVVFMGMGEPLLNFDNVAGAIRIMLDDLAYGLSRRRVTVSTAGLVPYVERLRETCPVSLAVSLHAPNDHLRDQLVPLNRKYPIRELLDACRRYVAGESRRRITFEYVMLAGVNDSTDHARQLATLLKGIAAKVNLIPFNPFPATRHRRSSQHAVDRFREVLVKAGLVTTTRKTRGGDIEAACGQLAGAVHDRTRRRERASVEPAAW